MPVLNVKDARRSERFYCDVLGFVQDWEHQFEPGFPLYISVSRGPLTLHLSEHEGGGTRQGELVIGVSDVDRTYAALLERGLEAEGPPEDRSYGVRDFGLRDPDGHRLVLATPLPTYATSPGRTYDQEES